MTTRTDEQIVEQTNGWRFKADYRFYMADHARAQQWWTLARKAQVHLTSTDPNDALDNLGWEHF